MPFVSGKGIGSFAGGQLQVALGTRSLFKGVSAITVATTGLVMIFYHAVGKKWEKKVLEEKRILLEEMELREKEISLQSYPSVEERVHEKCPVAKM